MGLSEQYTKEIQQELNYSGIWAPDVQVSPGDVGFFENYQFHKTKTLNDYGIQFNESIGSARTDIAYNSKNSVVIEVKLSGQGSAPGSSTQVGGDISVKFNRQHSILFHAAGCKIKSLANLDAIEKKIWKKYNDKEWTKKEVLIHQVMEADASTIIISDGSNSSIDFTTKANLNLANINLAHLNAGLQTTNVTNITNRYIARNKLTPLFEAWGIKRMNLFGKQFGPRTKAPMAPKNTFVFTKVNYNDYI